MKDLSYRSAPLVNALPSASADLAGVTVRLLADNKPYWCDGTTWLDLSGGGGSSTDSRLQVVSTNTESVNHSTSFIDAAGLAVALDANSTYYVKALVKFNTSYTTEGIRLSQSVPTGASVLAQWSIPTSTAANAFSNQRGPDSGGPSSGIDTQYAITLATASILVTTGATSGNLQIRFGDKTGGYNVRVLIGSSLVAIKIS